MQLDAGLHGYVNCESLMRSVKQLQDDIRGLYADLIAAKYPRFSHVVPVANLIRLAVDRESGNPVLG
jgi:hypothetical protein